MCVTIFHDRAGNTNGSVIASNALAWIDLIFTLGVHVLCCSVEGRIVCTISCVVLVSMAVCI